MLSVYKHAIGGKPSPSRRAVPTTAAHDRDEPVDEVRRWDEAIQRPDRPDRRGRRLEKGGDMREVLHLQPGYTVELAHLRRPVTLADDFTLGALCEGLALMEPSARAALEAVLGYPLAPWIDDCLRAAPATAGADEGLVEIRLRWRCESWRGLSAAGLSSTLVRPEVVGIGAVWPGEPYHREGVEARRDYAIPFTLLATLRHLPLRLDPVMLVQVEPPGAGALETVLSLPAPNTTRLALLAALFDEFSSYGSAEARDRELAELLHEDEAPEDGERITLQQLREERDKARHNILYSGAE
jgi:hypothetical protein